MTVTPIPDTRRETWTATVLNPDGTQIPLAMDQDQPARLTWRQTDQSPIGATLFCHGTPPELRHGQLVLLAYKANGASYPLPPLVPVIDKPIYELTGRWFSLDLVDQTINLAADGIDFPSVYDAGTPIVAKARQVIAASDPDLAVVLPSLDYTLRNPLDFPISTSPLAIVSKLLDAAGATPLAPSPDDGLLRSDAWLPPSARPVRMKFGPSILAEHAGYLPRVDVVNDYLAAPNVGHFIADGSAKADQLVGRWRDEAPSSPWGIPKRGRRIIATDKGEAATQTIADEKAMRLVIEARGRGRKATITGGFQPVWSGHVITTDYPDHPDLSATWEVTDVSVDTRLGSDMTWTLQEVIG